MSRLMSAIENISDTHIKEFAFVQIPGKSIPLWVKISSMVASLVLITLTVTTIIGKMITDDAYKSPSGVPNPTVYPQIVFNDTTFMIAPEDYHSYDLPENYVYVGKVLSNDNDDRGKNGYAWGCHVGDEIYQNPDNPHDVVVYTTFMLGDGERWFIKFVDFEYLRRE